MTGAERLAAALAGGGLVAYAMTGWPSVDATRRAVDVFVREDVAVVELGVPFSDPLADGDVIQAAGTAALAAGTTLEDALEIGAALAERVPVVLLLYANMVLRHGEERLADDLAAVGICGAVVPDLPMHEAGQVRAAFDAHGLALVPLIAPTSSDERIGDLAHHARGFVYVVTTLGTTGERDAAGADGRLAATIARVRRATDLPVACGFGIADECAVAAAKAAGADAVIVGSRLVRAVGAGDDAELASLVGTLRDAAR